MEPQRSGRLGPSIVIAGAIGSALRWAIGEVMADPTMALLCVNTGGSLLLGMVLAHRRLRRRIWLTLGFCGGLTTFSGYSVLIAERFNDHRYGSAAGIAVGLIAIAGVGFLAGYSGLRWSQTRPRVQRP